MEKTIEGKGWSCHVEGDDPEAVRTAGLNECRLLNKQGYTNVSARGVSEVDGGGIQIKHADVTLMFSGVSKTAAPLLVVGFPEEDKNKFVTLQVDGRSLG